MKQLLLISLALWTTACGTTRPDPGAAAEARSEGHASDSPIYLWEVTDRAGASVAFLLGSAHMTTVGTTIDQAVVDAYRSAALLAVELDLDTLDPMETQQRFLHYARYPEGTSLADVLEPEDLKRVLQAASTSGLPPDYVQQMKPWAVALTLAVLATQRVHQQDPPPRAGPTGDAGDAERAKPLGIGIDRYFTSRAKAESRRVVALETMDEQLKAISSASPELQKQGLLEILPVLEAGESPLLSVIDDYNRGQLDTPEAYFTSEDGTNNADMTAYRRATIDSRNALMVERVDAMLRRGERPFVVVGALHMLGEQGIPAMLRARGYTVSPIAPTGEGVALELPKESPLRLPTARLLRTEIAWPTPPVRQLDSDNPGVIMSIIEHAGVTLLYTEARAPAATITNLHEYYEHNVEKLAGATPNATTLTSEVVWQGPIKLSRFRTTSPTITIAGSQAWVDGKHHLFVTMVPTPKLTPEAEAVMTDAVNSFTVLTYEQADAAAARKPIVASLETALVGWLKPVGGCGLERMRAAGTLTETLRGDCVLDLGACISACKAGSGVKCVSAGNALQAAGESPAVVEALFSKACELGMVEGCGSQAGNALVSELRKTYGRDEAVGQCAADTLSAGCVKREPWSCAFAGLASAHGVGTTKSQELASTMWKLACTLDPSVCETVEQLRASVPKGSAPR